MKRVLIKASEIIPAANKYIEGIGRTNIELINQFIDIADPDIEFSIYCPTRRSIGFDHYDWPLRYHAYPLPHNALLPYNIESKYRRLFFRYDLLHLTANFDNVSPREPFVLTVHDLYCLNDSNRWLFDKCIRHSRAIVTCSEFTKADIVERFATDPDKITVVPWGISENIFYRRSADEIEKVRSRYNLPERYFFSCSCSNPRKNIDSVMRAFREFARTDNGTVLVLAWGNVPEAVKAEYAAEIASRRIILLPFIDDDELAALYSGALASYFVSSFEGFGFPVLESMACGTPIVTCRNSSLGEVGGSLAYYTRERDIDDLIGSMSHFSSAGEPDRDALQNHASQYKWRNTALSYLNFYKQAL